MNLVEAIILGIVQGLTEFIPVSSSGHLVLFHELFGLNEGGLLFDVALHIGTLTALVLFFRKDLARLTRAAWLRKGTDWRIVKLLALATIPAVIVGAALQDMAESAFRSPILVAVNLMVFGVIMLLVEKWAEKRTHDTSEKDITTKQALTMGVAQAAAIVPGVSRSGSTITAGRFVGLDRVSATRFSFLLAIPITAGAIVKVLASDNALSQVDARAGIFLVGIISAFISGLFAIRFLLKYLSKRSLAAFAYYRLALGVLVLIILA